MLPEAEHGPSSQFEFKSLLSIPPFVAGNFFLPKRAICLRLGEMARATMPKAAIDEDCYLLFCKCDVNQYSFHAHMDAIAEPLVPQPLSQAPLRLCILAADPRHYLRACQTHPAVTRVRECRRFLDMIARAWRALETAAFTSLH